VTEPSPAYDRPAEELFVGVDLFLSQDEFFVSRKQQVLAFCRALERSGLDVQWKAFGRGHGELRFMPR